MNASSDDSEATFEEVLTALGLENGKALARLLGVHRTTVWIWQRKGFPPGRRFQLAEMIEERGNVVPSGLFGRRAKAA